MASQAQFIICSICRAVHDAITSTPAWFLADGMLTPVRGPVCEPCSHERLKSGQHRETVIDRRSKEVDDVGQ